jgi:hypothetical protein
MICPAREHELRIRAFVHIDHATEDVMFDNLFLMLGPSVTAFVGGGLLFMWVGWKALSMSIPRRCG